MIRSGICAALAVMMALPVLAWPISPENASTILTRAGGEDVELTWVRDDVALLDATKGNFKYSVRMMDCDETKTCASALIFATFEMAGVPDLAMHEKTNHFNDIYPFGRAFILPRPDQQSFAVGVDYSLDLKHEANFDTEDVDKFMAILDAYVGHMSKEE